MSQLLNGNGRRVKHAPVRLDKANALAAERATISTANEQSSADYSRAVRDRRRAKAALADVLFENLLLIANENRGEPDAVRKFFTESLAR